MPALVFAMLSLSGSGDPVSPQDTWPQWRGPSGDNVAPGAGLPTQWGKTENVVWKAPLPGWGNSTPAIWKNDIFVTTQDGERLLALRLDRLTGKIVWEREVGKGTPRRKGATGNGRYHDENNMASPSPVTDGKHVWVHFGNGDIACYDYAGKAVWSFNFINRYGPYSIWWGHSNSPVLVGDLLISVCIQDPLGGGQSYVVAHDKRTGEEKWFTKRVTGATKEPGDGYTTPIPFRRDGRVEIIAFGGNVLDSYDSLTGKQLWECKPFTGNRVISSATLADGVIYAIQGMSGPLFAIQPGKAGEGDVTATNVKWRFKAGDTPDAPSPVVWGGLVFMVNNAGIAFCVDAATGKELWGLPRLHDDHRATPLVAGGKVYFVSKSGMTTIVEAGREFKMISQCDIGEEVRASPAAAGGDLYIRARSHVYRIGGKKE